MSASEDDHAGLRRLFHRTNWVLLEAGSCSEAVQVMRHAAIPVLIADSNLPDGTWRDLLRETDTIPSRPRVIIASRLADERMWTEVLDQGGFNVLEKPFVAEELFRVVSLAWLNWREEGKPLARAATAG